MSGWSVSVLLNTALNLLMPRQNVKKNDNSNINIQSNKETVDDTAASTHVSQQQQRKSFCCVMFSLFCFRPNIQCFYFEKVPAAGSTWVVATVVPAVW